jgi:hypothetical protein
VTGRFVGDLAGGLLEPQPLSVIQFRVRHGENLYDYAALRAANGLWYTTGGETRQGVTWAEMIPHIKAKIAGPLLVLSPIRSYQL